MDMNVATAVSAPPAPPGPSSQDRHITSAAIHHTRDRVEQELKDETLVFIRSLIGEVHIGAPGFGVVGELILGSAYEDMCRQVDTIFGDAIKAVEDCCQALTIGERNWQAAEDHNIVKYR
jgi:hypothetical protein